jgi:O-antigen/teichoic acid export membrane protein
LFSRIVNTFGTKALTAVINLAVAILLSQYLGPSGKGVQSLLLTTITFILVFANLVGGATLVYLVPRHDASRLAVPSYAWTLMTSLLAYGLLLAFPLIDREYIGHVCVLSVLNSFATIHISMLIGREKISTANYIGLVQPVILVISLATFYMIFRKATIDNYIISLYISFSAGLAASIYWFIKECGPLRKATFREYAAVFREMVGFGLMNQLAHVTQMASFRLSYYILDRYHGEAAVGIYSNGISLAESIWMIGKSISLVQYARISNTSDRKESAKLTVKMTKVSIAASILLLLPLSLMPPAFYEFLFGPGFSGTGIIIWSLALGVLVYNYSILIGHYFSGTGRYHINAITSGMGLIVSIFLYFGLIPIYGPVGAGLATSVSYIFTSIVFIAWFSREYPRWYLMFVPNLKS